MFSSAPSNGILKPAIKILEPAIKLHQGLLVVLILCLLVSPAQAHKAHHNSHRWHRHEQASASDEFTQKLDPSSVKQFMTGEYPEPHSHFCELIDAETGHVLYCRNPDTRRAPASLTKIMAAIVLLENGRLSDTVVAPPDVVGMPETSLHLKPGEKISLQDLLYAMLMRSANDCPVAGAYYLSGSVPAFVELMNDKADEIGCTNTHFVTPNGLYDPDHYSTAADMAKITRYAILHCPEFDTIVSTQRKRIKRSIDTNDCWVTSTFESFLKYYPGADGVKTGYISQAGHCFVGSATHNHWRLIAVALDSQNCREDVMGMLSYGFHHFRPHVLLRAGTPEGNLALPGDPVVMPVVAGGDLTDFLSTDPAVPTPTGYSISIVALPASKIRLPIKMGDAVGTLTLQRAGQAVATAPAVAAQPYVPPTAAGIAPTNFKGLVSSLGKMPRAWMIGLIGAALVIGISATRYAGSTAKDNRRRRRWLAP